MGVFLATYNSAIVAQAYPECVCSMLAYTLTIRVATEFGGHSWLTYNTVFCNDQLHLATDTHSHIPSIPLSSVYTLLLEQRQVCLSPGALLLAHVCNQAIVLFRKNVLICYLTPSPELYPHNSVYKHLVPLACPTTE